MKRIAKSSPSKQSGAIVKKFITDEVASKFSGSLLDEFSAFLSDRNNVQQAIMGELTKSAGKLNVGFDYSDLNPEIIPYNVLEKMRVDSQVAIGLAIIKLPILALNWSVRCSKQTIREFVRKTMRKIWRKTMKNILSSVDFGFVVCEKVWDRNRIKLEIGEDENAKVILDRESVFYKKIKAIYPGDIKILTDDHNNYNGFEQDAGISSELVGIPKEKSFIFTHEEEFGNFYGRTRLKPSYMYWYMKQLVLQFLMRYLERRGIPPIIVTAPPGHVRDANGNLIDNLTSALKLGKSMLSNSVGVKPYTESKGGSKPQWDIEYLQDDPRAAQFIEVLNWLDTSILRGLLVPERAITQDSGTGSFSMSQTHADFFLLAEEGLIKDIEEEINAQLVTPLVNLNFGGRHECSIDLDSLQFGKKEMIKNLLVRLLDKADTFLEETGTYPFDALPDLEKLAEIVEIPLRPIRLHTLEELGLKKSKVNPKNGNANDKLKKNEDKLKPKPENGKTQPTVADLSDRLNKMNRKYKKILSEMNYSKKEEEISLQS